MTTPFATLQSEKLPNHAVLKHFSRGIPAGSAHDAAAGMGSRTTQVKVADWRLILCPAQDRAHEVQLLKRQFALEDIAFGQRKRAFDIEWRQHLTMQNNFA